MSIYTTLPLDTLPSIAEACGHSGEWAAILYFNETALTDYNNIQPGTEVVLPDGWTVGEPEPQPEPPPKVTTRSSSST
jgi:hypothetical protein